jgi:hypothetical protein
MPNMPGFGGEFADGNINLSQGPRWKALISKYMSSIPVNGDAPGPAEHSISSGPPPGTAVSSAMKAKVGAAASDSQSAAPWTWFCMVDLLSVGTPLVRRAIS